MAHRKSLRVALVLALGLFLSDTSAIRADLQALGDVTSRSGPQAALRESDLDLPCDPDPAGGQAAVASALSASAAQGAESLLPAAAAVGSQGLNPLARSPVLRL